MRLFFRINRFWRRCSSLNSDRWGLIKQVDHWANTRIYQRPFCLLRWDIVDSLNTFLLQVDKLSRKLQIFHLVGCRDWDMRQWFRNQKFARGHLFVILFWSLVVNGGQLEAALNLLVLHQTLQVVDNVFTLLFRSLWHVSRCCLRDRVDRGNYLLLRAQVVKMHVQRLYPFLYRSLGQRGLRFIELGFHPFAFS